MNDSIASEMAKVLRQMAGTRWAKVYEHDAFFWSVAGELERLRELAFPPVPHPRGGYFTERGEQ